MFSELRFQYKVVTWIDNPDLQQTRSYYLAPHPLPVSAWKYSWNKTKFFQNSSLAYISFSPWQGRRPVWGSASNSDTKRRHISLATSYLKTQQMVIYILHTRQCKDHTFIFILLVYSIKSWQDFYDPALEQQKHQTTTKQQIQKSNHAKDPGYVATRSRNV